MKNVLRLAIVDPDDASRESTKSILLGMDVVWLEAECSRYDFFSDVVAQTHPDISLVALDGDPDRALQLVSELQLTSPDCAILVTSSSNDGNLILRAMRAGVKEFLTNPVQLNDLMAALDRIGDQRFGGGDQGNRGCSVIAIAGATGGVGSTSLAVNLGCALAENEQHSVVLMDLDMCLGDADVFLDTIPEYTLVDVAQNIARLDITLLKRSLTKHSSGLFLLPRPVQLDDVASVTPEDLTRVIGLMKASFSHVLLDLSKSYSPLDMAAIEQADHVLLITQLDLPSLRNVVRLMMSFGEIEGLKEKTRVIVNRTGLQDSQISMKKAEETIGTEFYHRLPNDYRVMIEVRNNGVPLIEQAPKAAITHAVRELASKLSGAELEAVGETGGSSIVSKLGGMFGGRK